MASIALAAPEAEVRQPGNLVLLLRYLRRNKGLAIGLGILLFLVLFTAIGFLVVNPKAAYPLAAATKKPPSLQYPLGTVRAVTASAGRPDRAAGRLSIAAGLASGIAPFALGALADRIGTHTAFLLVPGLLAAAATGVLISRRDQA